MLQSGLNTKSITETVRSSESRDEAEVTACIAAVRAYLDAEAQEAALASQSELPPATNSWRNASRLEAAGIKKKLKPTTNLWRFSGLSIALCIWISMFATAKSEAADLLPDTLALNSVSDARYVPAQTRSKHTLVKIGLAIKVSRVDIEALDGAQVRDASTGALVATLPAQSLWTLNIDSAKNISFTGKNNNVDGAQLASSQPPPSTISKVAYFPTAPRLDTNKFLLPSQSASDTADGVSGYMVVPRNDKKGNQVVVVNGKLYRGAVWLKPGAPDGASDAGGITVINIVDLEDYLLSVLPGEMPSSWPLEALKAQAVAARSYAIANIGKHSKEGYDLRATIDDQVYNGVSSENANSNRAVAETEGLILKHEGKPVSAFFHSTSGGSTEVAEHVWGRPVPYLRMVPDYDDMSPHFAWNRKVKVDDMARAIGADLGPLTSFSIVSRTPSNRVKDTVLVGANGSKTISGETLRKVFKLPSTNFNIVCKDNTLEFLGRGNGHGLGLSQWGARALAEHGYNAAQILTYYYKDVSVDYLADSVGI
ncbi:MAG: SpoIID/LytB domain-containing protein [Candidatus Melainabacteria bacterium]|nr:MAG: SpoIID/LytB domain-containing protein [Candidatus Melainabacteria bacterium]